MYVCMYVALITHPYVELEENESEVRKSVIATYNKPIGIDVFLTGI